MSSSKDFVIRKGVLKRYKGPAGEVTVPDSVTIIGDSAFLDCADLLSVTLPDGVTRIGKYAFSGCGDLQSINLPEGLTSIGEWAFEACGSLQKVNLPDTVTDIGDYAFSDCRSLADAEGFVTVGGVLYDYYGHYGDAAVPEGVRYIGGGAFYQCTGLKSVTLPDTVTSIGYGAFQGCRNLQNISLPEGLTGIGGWAFYGCGSLSAVTLPGGVTVIGGSTFQDCASLYSVTLPESVTSIGDSAFKGCRNLTRIDLPDTVENIGDSAFRGCRGLRNITVPRGVTAIEAWTFSGCRDLRSVNLPDGLTAIGDSAFLDCGGLENVALPDSVTAIGKNAFRGCGSLQSIALPEGISDIGDSAFSGCRGLADGNGFVIRKGTLYGYYGQDGNAVIPRDVTVIAGGAFSDCPGELCITVPDSVRAVSDNAFSRAVLTIRIKNWFPGLNRAVKRCSVRAIFTDNPSLVPGTLRRASAIGFALEPEDDLTSETSLVQMSYLARNASKLCGQAFDIPEMLRFMCGHMLIKAKDFDIYESEAERRDEPELTALILNYQNKLGFDAIWSARERKEQRVWDYADRRAERAANREADGNISGLSFVTAGRLRDWRSRDKLRSHLELHGAKLGGKVTMNTDYLVTNDVTASSEKNRKALELGVPVIGEEEFNRMVGRFYPDAESVEIPAWVRTIPSDAFSRAVCLKSVTIPGSVTAIEDGAFVNCPGVTVRAPAGSFAEEYARNNGISFEAE